MPYARQDYTIADIQLALEGTDTNKTVGAKWDAKAGMFKQSSQPTPHGGIHGADELHSHPLFAKARVQASILDAKTGAMVAEVGTHSVMDAWAMIPSLVAVFNSALMQPFLAQLDGGSESVVVKVNLTKAPGNLTQYKTGAPTATQAVTAYTMKLRANPGNKQIPIIQTCVPLGAPHAGKNVGGVLQTKKGASFGFVF